jgi:hypothetical protein
MSETLPPYWDNVKALLELFFPQYFDPEDPAYIPPEMLDALLALSETARPWCLPEDRANLAQAFFVAYLISVQKESSSGKQVVTTAGPIVSEKEGDIQVTYATVTSGGESSGKSGRPSSDPWDAWNRLFQICARGAITTRFGDPCQSPSGTRITDSNVLSLTLSRYAVGLLKSA